MPWLLRRLYTSFASGVKSLLKASNAVARVTR